MCNLGKPAAGHYPSYSITLKRYGPSLDQEVLCCRLPCKAPGLHLPAKVKEIFRVQGLEFPAKRALAPCSQLSCWPTPSASAPQVACTQCLSIKALQAPMH